MTDITLDEKALAETQAEFDQVPLGLVEAIIAAWFRRASPSQVAPQPQAGEADVAHGYATRLLTSLMEKHYPDRSPEWAPLPDLYGVLTQIDNLSTGLVRASPQPANPAQVTDAIRGIVDDALNSAIPEPWEVAEHATQRILAAIGAGGQTVAVKPLEWKRQSNGNLRGLGAAFSYRYIIYPRRESFLLHHASSLSDDQFETEDEAKDAAQADYEQRILSALSQPHPADERVVEAASAVLKWLDGGCSSWGVPEQQIRILALSATEGRDNG